MRENVRAAAVAGTWYPGSGAELAAAVDAHLEAARVAGGGPVRAIVAPHAGLMYSGSVAACAYKAVSACRPAAVVLVGPSHFVPFQGVSIWPHGAWETPLGPVAVESRLAAIIAAQSPAITVQPAAHAREHSVEMQLPFVARLLPAVPIVPLVMGSQTRETAMRLGEAVAGGIAEYDAGADGVLIVASSDLSHYENAVDAWALDSAVVRHVNAFDADGLMDALEREPRHACGGGPIVAVLRAARALGASHAEVLRYADSGDVSGDKSSVVGYMAAAVW